MKKTILILLVVCVAAVLLVAMAGMYKFKYLASQPGYDVDGNKVEEVNNVSSYMNATYRIDGESVTLVDGYAKTAAAPGSAANIITRHFGNEVRVDLNDDDTEDVVFLLTQEAGGTGIFFYVVAALETEDGWVGSHAFLLGDRIAPQTTEISQNPNHQNVIVVNYMDRELGEGLSEQPTLGKSVWLKLDPASLQFGEVEQNFSGEANPDIMTLDMQTWTWIQTQYNNDTLVVPNQADAFTLTFNGDGSVSATTDCNTINGTYEVTGNQITFGPMAMTKMLCPESQEQAFAASLTEAQSFFFTARGELIFDLQFDSGSVTFR